MPTILDSLVVELKLDSGDFTNEIGNITILTKGLTDSLNELSASFQHVNDEMAKSANGFKNASAGIGEAVNSARNSVQNALVPAINSMGESLEENNPHIRNTLNLLVALNVQMNQNTIVINSNNEAVEKQKEGITDLFKKYNLFNVGMKGAAFIGNFIGDTAKAGTEVGNLADNLEEAANNLSAWSQVSKNLNNGRDDTAALLDKYHSMQTDVLFKGGSPLLDLFRREQIPVIDSVTHKLRDSTKVFGELSEKLKKLPRNEAFNLIRLGGVSNDNANILLTTENLQKQIEYQREHLALTNEEAKAAQKLTQLENQRSAILEKIGRNLLFNATMTIAVSEKINESLNGIARSFENVDSQGGQSTQKEVNRLNAIEGGDYSVYYGKNAKSEAQTPSVEQNNSRGFRNNDPYNLNFAGQKGAHKESGANGRFAVFNQLQDSVNAFVHQLKLYQDRDKINTIEGIVSKYAPKADNNNTVAYIADLVKQTHFAANQKLNLHDSATLMSLSRSIINHENGSGGTKISQNMIDKANGRGTTVNINSVTIETKSTDASGIANEFANHWTQAAQLASGVN